MTEEHHTVKNLEFRLASLHDDVRDVRGSMNKLADAIVKLALIEERQSNTNLLVTQVNGKLDRMETRISILEVNAPQMTRTSLWVDRGMLFVVGAVAMYILKTTGLLTP